jgi:hypothetical protein
VQLRDLRLLDPQLHSSYPSALLCRDKALVVNLEHIKCIITKDEVLILNADEESVVGLLSSHRRVCKGGAGTCLRTEERKISCDQIACRRRSSPETPLEESRSTS